MSIHRYLDILREANSFNPEDVVHLDIPLLIRLLEFAREDAADDAVLHKLAEALRAGCAEDQVLTMNDYDTIMSQCCPVASEPSHMRTLMDRMVNEVRGPNTYDFTTTIPNPIPFPANGTDEEKDAWEEEIDVGVDYRMAGGYRAAVTSGPSDRWAPAEYPDIDEVHVYRLDSGEEMTNLPDDIKEYVDQKIWDHWDNDRGR